MIYFLYGEDREGARAKANDMIGALQKKKPDAAFFKLTDENYSDSILEEYVGGQGLFENKYIVFLDNVFRSKDAKEAVAKKIKDIGVSDNIFIFLEEKLDKATLAKVEKNGGKIQSFDLPQAKKGEASSGRAQGKEFNIFWLTDALGERDRKHLWLLYLETMRRGIAPEEVNGVLFWQVKNMLLAKKAASAKEAGLSPFVFSKSRAYAGNFSDEELQRLSSDIVSMYHDAHRGLCDFAVALEKFVLKI